MDEDFKKQRTGNLKGAKWALKGTKPGCEIKKQNFN